jgi:hypothetical protein
MWIHCEVVKLGQKCRNSAVVSGFTKPFQILIFRNDSSTPISIIDDETGIIHGPPRMHRRILRLEIQRTLEEIHRHISLKLRFRQDE